LATRLDLLPVKHSRAAALFRVAPKLVRGGPFVLRPILGRRACPAFERVIASLIPYPFSEMTPF
jgi:hypothetical protein